MEIVVEFMSQTYTMRTLMKSLSLYKQVKVVAIAFMGWKKKANFVLSIMAGKHSYLVY